jgi:hypothetical protein
MDTVLGEHADLTGLAQLGATVHVGGLNLLQVEQVDHLACRGRLLERVRRNITSMVHCQFVAEDVHRHLLRHGHDLVSVLLDEVLLVELLLGD